MQDTILICFAFGLAHISVSTSRAGLQRQGGGRRIVCERMSGSGAKFKVQRNSDTKVKPHTSLFLVLFILR